MEKKEESSKGQTLKTVYELESKVEEHFQDPQKPQPPEEEKVHLRAKFDELYIAIRDADHAKIGKLLALILLIFERILNLMN